LVRTAALNGLRVGELLALRWQDLDFEEGFVNVNNKLWRRKLEPPKTKDSKSAIGLARFLSEILSAHKESSRWTGPEDFVFVQGNGVPWDPDHLRRQVLYPAMERAKVARQEGTGFHLFSHSSATALYLLTRDIKATQMQLRHSRIGTTSDVYTHPDGELLKETAELLAAGITGSMASEKVQ